MVGRLVEDRQHSGRIPILSSDRGNIGERPTNLLLVDQALRCETGEHGGNTRVGEMSTQPFLDVGRLERTVAFPQDLENFHFEFAVGAPAHVTTLHTGIVLFLHSVVVTSMTVPSSLQRVIVRAVLLFAGALCVFIPADARPALAHNSYEGGSPRDGDVLAVAPTTWTAMFTKPVPLASASGEVIDASGVRTKLPAPRHGSSDSVIVFDLPAGLAGKITARWRLVGTDGHVISGRVSFAVQSAVTAAPSTTIEVPDTLVADEESISTVPEPVRVVLRFANYLALILLGGVLFTEWFVAKGSISTAMGRRLLWSGALGATVVPLLTFFVFANDLRAPGEGLGGAVSTALSLTPGLMLVFRVGSGVAAGAILRAGARGGSVDDRVIGHVAAIMAMYCVALAYGGHSRSLSAPWLGIPADVLHVAGVSVWLGGLVAMLFVVIPVVDADQAVSAFARFSVAAERAVIVIVVTGVVQTARLHGDVVSLFTSSHGLLLVLKVSTVLLMLRMAARNRRLLAGRQLDSQARAARTKAALVKASLTEIAIGAATIGLTSVLVAVSPG